MKSQAKHLQAPDRQPTSHSQGAAWDGLPHSPLEKPSPAAQSMGLHRSSASKWIKDPDQFPLGLTWGPEGE